MYPPLSERSSARQCTGASIRMFWGLIPLGGGGGVLGATLQQFAWSEALQSFLFAPQWTIPN